MQWREHPRSDMADPIALRRIKDMAGIGSSRGDFARADIDAAIQVRGCGV